MGGSEAGQAASATVNHGSGPEPARGRSIHVPKTAELVAGTLRRQIVKGEVAEGESLPTEAALMDQFGISRPTLREAFRILESERLISVRRGARGGAQVRTPNGEGVAQYAALVLQYRGTTVRDVYQARTVIEPACVRMLAERRSAADLALLKDVVAREEQDVDGKLIMDLPSFHRLVVRLCGNKTLALLSEVTHNVCSLATAAQLKSGPQRVYRRDDARRLKSWHASVVELIEQRDGLGAEKLWADHLDEIESFMVEGVRTQTVLDLFG